MEFQVPGSFEELEASSETSLCAANVQRVNELGPDEVEGLVNELSTVLCENEPVQILEQETFDLAYSLVSGFMDLEPMARIRVLDSIASNLTVLCQSCSALDATSDPISIQSHRSAYLAYVCLLAHIVDVSEAESRASAAAPAAKGKGKKAKSSSVAEWRWDSQCEQMARPLAAALEADLFLLFRPSNPSEKLLNLLSRTATKLLENQAAMKVKEVRGYAADVLGHVAIRYGKQDTVATAVLHALYNCEHAVGPCAEVVERSYARTRDYRLAARVLMEIGGEDPAEYSRMQKSDSKALAAIGDFLVELAERAPMVVLRHMSFLSPLHDGEAYALRSAIVSVLGHCIVACTGETTASAAAADREIRLKAKQGFLDALVGRTHDVNSFTRARVLKTWVFLLEKQVVPIGHWMTVTDMAIGRLADKTSAVRRDALKLVQALLYHNPFGRTLQLSFFKTALTNAEEKLASAEEQARRAEARELAAQERAARAAEAAAKGEEPPAEEPDNSAFEAPEVPISEEDRQRLPGIVASLKAAVDFVTRMAQAVPHLCALLSSAVVAEQTEAIDAIVALRRNCVDGAQEAVRRAMALVFSREEKVRAAAEAAAEELYLGSGGAAERAGAADGLIELVSGAALGELAAVEAILALFVRKGRVTAGGPIASALWKEVAGQAAGEAGAEAAEAPAAAAAAARRAVALEVLAMLAAANPAVVGESRQQRILQAAAAGAREDARLARAAALALQRSAQAPGAPRSLPRDSPVFKALAGLLSVRAGGALSGAAWFPTAEQAIGALYALHPDPEAICSALLARMAEGAGLRPAEVSPPAAAAGDDAGAEAAEAPLVVGAEALARFLFALGTVALKHLVHVEGAARRVQQWRAAREKQALEAAAEAASRPQEAAKKKKAAAAAAKGKGKKAAAAAEEEEAEASGASGGEEDADPEGLAAQLGQGAASADAQLDALREACEAEIVRGGFGRSLVAAYAPAVAAICARPALLNAHPLLRGAAVAALCRLCAVDGAFCERHLGLLFSALRDTKEAGTKAALLVSMADLAFRFPNAMEPWTEFFYGTREMRTSLHDGDDGVRKHALTVLSHLVLNDMMKVKGYISEMARCLEDSVPSIQALARLFFFELSHRTGNPIYNLLPDILSRLSADASLPEEQFRSIMRHLIKLIVEPDGKQDADPSGMSTKLLEKLLSRMPDAVAAGGKAPRDVGFCVGQLNVTEKGLKKLEDGWKLYEAALADGDVYDALAGAVARGRKAAKGEQAKAAFEALEQRLLAAHEERAETAAADARALNHDGSGAAAAAAAARYASRRRAGGEAAPAGGEEEGGEEEEGEEQQAEGAGGEGAGAGPRAKENAPPPPPAAKGGRAAKGAGAKKAAAAAATKKKPAARKAKKAASSDEEESDASDADAEDFKPAAKGGRRAPLRAVAAA